MATYDDILGNGGGTPFPKGSKEWHEQQQDGLSVPPPVKGTQEWAEQKAATAPVVTALKPDITTTPPPPTKQEGSTVVPFHMLNCSRNLILILHQLTKNLLKRRKSRNVTKFLLQLVMVYRHSRTCSSPRSTLQICIPVKIPCQNVPE